MVKKIKSQIRRRQKAKYFTDKSIIKFLLQHLETEKIDFSKVKISPFSDDVDTEEEEYKYSKIKNSIQNSEMPNIPQKNQLPVFGLSLLNDLSSDNNTHETVKFSSSIFQ